MDECSIIMEQCILLLIEGSRYLIWGSIARYIVWFKVPPSIHGLSITLVQ